MAGTRSIPLVDTNKDAAVCGATPLLRDIVERARAVMPNIPKNARPSMKLVERPSTHALAMIDFDEPGSSRLFVKGARMFAPAANSYFVQSLASEYTFLSQVAPLIESQDARLSSPRLIAYYPESDLLVTEYVEGQSLKDMLLVPGRINRKRARGLVQLTAKWLAVLHESTTVTESGDPFEFFAWAFKQDRVFTTLERFGLASLLRPIEETLERARDSFSGQRLPLCTIHGEFTPIHVLVQGERIAVIDPAFHRRGYRFEDVAFYGCFYNMLLPWRRALSALSGYSQREQLRDFFQAYLSFASPISTAERICLRFARLHSMIHMLACLQSNRGLRGVAFNVLANDWYVRRFRSACAHEMRAVIDALNQPSHVQLTSTQPLAS